MELMVHIGNLVKVNDVSVLVVMNQITPIDVAYSPPKHVLPRVRKYIAHATLNGEALPLDDQ